MIALIGSAVIARRNLGLGRGDMSGATRLALVYFTVRMLLWIFEEHHNGFINIEFVVFFIDLATAVFLAFFLWLLYIALEPFVRRRWPQRIISWSRLLRGDYRDPLVGRDILIGAAAAGLVMLGSGLTTTMKFWMGRPFEITLNPGTLIMGSHFVERFTSQLSAGLFLSFITLFLLLLLVILLRRESLALVVLWVLMTLFATLVADAGFAPLPSAAFGTLITLFVLYRYGLLALCAMTFIGHLWVFYPMTTELKAWYALDFVIAAVLCTALAAYGCYTSLAGQSLFSGRSLDD